MPGNIKVVAFWYALQHNLLFIIFLIHYTYWVVSRAGLYSDVIWSPETHLQDLDVKCFEYWLLENGTFLNWLLPLAILSWFFLGRQAYWSSKLLSLIPKTVGPRLVSSVENMILQHCISVFPNIKQRCSYLYLIGGV